MGAAQLLGVSNVLVNGAFRAGLLPGRQIGQGKVKIALADVAAFARDFVTPAEGTAIFGLPGKGFYCAMTAMGFQPAGVAVKAAIWRRSDVEAAVALSHAQRNSGSAESAPTKHESRKRKLAPA